MANADRIIELLHEAKSRPAGAERDRFLTEGCRDDVTLKEQIISLLEADAEEGDSDFLKLVPIVRQTTLLTEKPGDRIGRYKLLEQIGEGGCGVVYMAEQEQPVRRRVALKVIKLGMDTKQVIARFEAERQALALMDHPNIAKIFDAGVTGVSVAAGVPPAVEPGFQPGGQTIDSSKRGDSSVADPGGKMPPSTAGETPAATLSAGRPYFVMELVRGIKITDYCDQNNLSTNERLELFIQVCQAIQHAHQKGIIHRDIKPSNILVTHHDDVAVPKVIDFGIAKATTGQLTDKTVFTAFAQFIGTPAYMSPEQAQMSGLDIDTRSDIYSLGVLLYELLTGSPPFDQKELLAAGLDEMRRTIREVEPAKPSTRLTQELVAADVSPLKSHPESARNVRADSRRLLQEVKGDLDWIAMKCLEKDRTRRYETANGLAADIQRHLSNEPVTARPPSRWYEFQKTVRRHKVGFAATAAVIIVLGLGVLASTWQALRATRAEREQIKLREEADAEKKIAQTEAAKSQQVARFMQDMLKGVGPSAALGRDTKMLREILDKTAERIAEDLKDQPDVEAELRNAIGTVYWELGDWDKSWAMHSQALAMQRKLLGNEHPSVANSLNHLGTALRFQNKLAESEAAYRESLAMRRKLLGNEHSDVAQSLNDLASLLSIELKNDEPQALLREALAIRRKLCGNEHRDVAMSLDNLAHVLNRHGQGVEAVAMHHEALAIRKKVLGDTHPELILSFRNLARALQGQGELAKAETMLRDALLVCQKLLGDRHPDMPTIRSELGNLLREQGNLKEAEALQTQVDASSQTIAVSMQEAGNYLQQRGWLAEAERNFRESLAIKKKLFGDHREVAAALASLGLVLQQERKLAEAELVYREALTVEKKLSGMEHPRVASSLHQLAVVLQDSGRASEAEALFREALAMRAKLLGGEHGDVADSMMWIGLTLSSQGKRTEALEMQRAALQIGRKLPAWENWVANALLVLGYELQQQAKLVEAEAACREAVSIRRKLFTNGHLELAYAIHGLAGMLKQAGKWSEAEALAREGLAMRRRLLGNEHPDVASSLNQLWEFLAAQGKAMELEALLPELPGAESSAPEAAQAQFGHFLWQVGNAYMQHQQFKDAGRAYERALQKFEQLQVQFPTNAYYRQEQAYSLRLLSDERQRTGRLAEAEASLRSAWDIYTQLAKEVPTSTFYPQEVAFTQGKIAEVLVAQGKSNEAEAMCRDELAAKKKAFGNFHREVEVVLVALGRVLRRAGKLDEAEAIWREELAVERKLSGDEHLFVANSLTSLASVLYDADKLVEAEALFREALAMRRKLGAEPAAIDLALVWLAIVLEEQGKLPEVETVYREQLAQQRRLSGNTNPETAKVMKNLAEVLGRQGKFAEAKSLFREAAGHANADTLNEIAFALATAPSPMLRDGPMALTLAEKAVAGTNRKNPMIVNTLAAAHAEMGQFTNAVRVQLEAIALLQDEKQKQDYITRLKLYDSGLPYRKHGQLADMTSALLKEMKPAAAEPFARECLALRERIIPDDWRTFNARSMLGGSLLGQKKYAEAEPLLLAGYEGMKQREDKIPAVGKARLKENLQRLVQLYEVTGQSDKVAEWSKKLAEFEQTEAGKKTATAKP